VIRDEAVEVARAWASVKDAWIVRRNKMRATQQWEVVHDWGVTLVSEETQKVLRRFTLQDSAVIYANKCEAKARGNAVLRMLKIRGYKL
jgi:hypothetical protein